MAAFHGPVRRLPESVVRRASEWQMVRKLKFDAAKTRLAGLIEDDLAWDVRAGENYTGLPTCELKVTRAATGCDEELFKALHADIKASVDASIRVGPLDQDATAFMLTGATEDEEEAAPRAPIRPFRQLTNTVYIGGFAPELDYDELLAICREVGAVKSLRMVYGDDGISKGFAFCKYYAEAIALSAIRNLNGREVQGHTLRVDHAE